MIVVDCGSRNGVGKAVAKRFPSAVVITRPDDVGFSRAANLGLEIARGDYALLLSPDVVVSKDTVRTMIDYLTATPYAAAVSPELRAKNDSPSRAPQPFPSLRREFIANWSSLAGQFGLEEEPFSVPTDASPVEGIPSACMLIRATALRQIGGLDERNMAAFAELDWCRRADKAGWEVHYDPRLHVTDFGTGEPGDHTDARWSYFRKHHGNVAATLVEAMHLLRSAVDSAKNSNVVQSMKQVERFRGRHDGGRSLDV